jgi:hypothetical protein
MQHTRAIPVAWLGSGSCQTGPRAEYPLLLLYYIDKSEQTMTLTFNNTTFRKPGCLFLFSHTRLWHIEISSTWSESCLLVGMQFLYFFSTEFQSTVSLPIACNMLSQFYYISIHIHIHMLQGTVNIFRFLVPLCCVRRQWLVPFYMASRHLDTSAAPLIWLSITRILSLQ